MTRICREVMSKTINGAKGPQQITTYCNSTEWSREQDRLMPKTIQGTNAIVRVKVRTSVPYCKNGHPMGGRR